MRQLKNKKLYSMVMVEVPDAQHLATELTVKYKKRHALPAISLATDNSTITAIGNDFGFENIFSRQLEAIGVKGDVAIAITTWK